MFTELHQLAQAASLLISAAAEGDQLRVTINFSSTGKTGKTPHPLVLVGTPEELDEGFAQAIAIYEPSALPLLDQARAAAAANSGTSTPKRALPAPTETAAAPAGDAPAKRGRGRPPKNRDAAPTEPADTDDTPEVDPRQMDLVAEGAGTAATAAPATDEGDAASEGDEPGDAPPALAETPATAAAAAPAPAAASDFDFPV